MTRKTARDLEADLTKLEAVVRASASDTLTDPDLTPEGRTKRHAAWVKERGWREQFDAAATGLTTALEGAQAKAAQARATMTTIPEGDAALAQELRLQRRSKRIEAALNAGGTAALTKLIADADDAELPFLLEFIADHHESIGGDIGKAGAQIVEQSLRDRSPDYDAAARMAGQAGNALAVAREKVAYVGKLIEDPSTPPPGEYELARMSITVAGEEVGDLAA